MTHMYLGNELLNCAPLIPAGILALLKKHRQDFLYGNLMADIILGKKYLPDDKSSHSWDVGLKLLDQAKTWPERAFAYHMWTEVWLSDRWMPLDATLGRGGIGAAHLKLTSTSFGGVNAYADLLPIVQAIGQLELEIVSVE